MSPVRSCRLFRLEPSPAVLFGVRAAELRPVPPSSAWFVCKWFAPKQAEALPKPATPTDRLTPRPACNPTWWPARARLESARLQMVATPLSRPWPAGFRRSLGYDPAAAQRADMATYLGLCEDGDRESSLGYSFAESAKERRLRDTPPDQHLWLCCAGWI
jgi:hypothetical protein